MAAIRIAHISDLHFGMTHQVAVWNALAAHLLAEPRPHGIIVTGDIVDTPDPELFARAGAQFQRFTDARIPWVVCAGNHDRHGRGNVGFLGRLAAALRGSPTVGTAFDVAFAGHVATLEDLVEWPPPNTSPPPASARWQLRLFGVDSSRDARYSAQGFVGLDVFERLSRQARTGDAHVESYDLLIGLIHHHLLPIAALEKSAQEVKGLFSPTVLVNAGTVLEAMANNNVNLVLHGHEHHRSVARFGVLGRPRATDIVVVGAGSATGADTSLGCDASRASYNVLELRPDGSVWLREMRIVSGQWTAHGDADLLLTGRSVREGRVLRRRSIEARPVARLTRHFIVGDYRDINVHETRTAWPLAGDELAFDVHRPSGSPVFDALRIEWGGGGETRWGSGIGDQPASFRARRDGTRAFALRVPVRAGAATAPRVELQYLWARSAVLTGTDVAQLTDAQMDFFRHRGREAVSAHVPIPLESLTIAVSVPAVFAPPSEGWQVYVERPDAGPHAFERNVELQEYVSAIPGGHATLTIPFPLPDYRYFLSWPVKPGFLPDATVLAMRQRAEVDGQSWMTAVAQRVDALIGTTDPFSVTLYLPDVVPDKALRFHVAGFATGGGDPQARARIPEPELLYRARNEHDGLLGAWYGEASWIERDPDEAPDPAVLWPGETTVLLLPAYHVAWTPPTEPWGILRLGFGPGVAMSDERAEAIALAATVVV